MYINRTNKIIQEKKWYIMNYYLKEVNHSFIRNKIYIPQNFKIPYYNRYESIDFKPLKNYPNYRKIKSTLEGININKSIPFKERYECRDF